jgi:hypothetical protein
MPMCVTLTTLVPRVLPRAYLESNRTLKAVRLALSHSRTFKRAAVRSSPWPSHTLSPRLRKAVEQATT